MTRSEAIDYLTALWGSDSTSVDETIALEMAIKALEQEPCDDAISREAAICLADELKDDLPDDDRLSDMVMSHNEGILEYQTKLSLLPSVTPAEKVGRWIPVSERLPEIHQDILLSFRSLDIEVGFRGEEGPYFYCHGAYIEPQNVLAWMPLPEPYRAESEE